MKVHHLTALRAYIFAVTAYSFWSTILITGCVSMIYTTLVSDSQTAVQLLPLLSAYRIRVHVDLLCRLYMFMYTGWHEGCHLDRRFSSRSYDLRNDSHCYLCKSTSFLTSTLIGDTLSDAVCIIRFVFQGTVMVGGFSKVMQVSADGGRLIFFK